MAYDWNEIYDQAIQIIEEKGIRKITHLLTELPIGITSFYEWEAKEPDKAKEIRSKIDQQKTKRKIKLLDKWEISDNPALQIAAFKLLADEEEADILSTSKVKQDSTVEFKNKPTINLSFGEDSKGE